MVQARTRITNQLQAVALNEGLRSKKRLWREHGREQLESFRLAPWASRRRRDLVALLDRLNPTIPELNRHLLARQDNITAFWRSGFVIFCVDENPVALHDRRLHRWCWYRISSKSLGQDDAASRHIAEEKGGQNGQENEIPGLTRSACQKSR